MKALNIPVCNKSNFKNNTSFQLFGADVAPDNNLNVKLIEINKGPDLNAKDKRDNEVKDKVVRDVFDITGVIKSNKVNEFSTMRWNKLTEKYFMFMIKYMLQSQIYKLKKYMFLIVRLSL